MSVQRRLLEALQTFEARHGGWDLRIRKTWIAGSDRGRGEGESLYVLVNEGFAFEIPLEEPPQSHENGPAEVGPQA